MLCLVIEYDRTIKNKRSKFITWHSNNRLLLKHSTTMMQAEVVDDERMRFRQQMLTAGCFNITCLSLELLLFSVAMRSHANGSLIKNENHTLQLHNYLQSNCPC